jgi:hypothetical protein
VARGRPEIRALVRQFLTPGNAAGAAEVAFRTNAAGEVASLALSLPPLGLHAVPGTADGTPGTGVWERLKQLGRLLGKGFVAFIPAFATLLGIVWVLAPDLKPDEPPPPPSILGATVSNVALEERVQPPDAPAYFVVSYDVEFVGYQGEESPLAWAGFDARTLQRVGLEAPQDWGNPVAAEAEAPNDRVSVQLRLKVPPQAQCIFVRVYAFDEDGTRLDYGDTPPFDTHDPANSACAGPAGCPRGSRSPCSPWAAPTGSPTRPPGCS